jgi:hypothetical protein
MGFYLYPRVIYIKELLNSVMVKLRKKIPRVSILGLCCRSIGFKSKLHVLVF